ncbi:MAG: hypothetical protein AAFQ65_01430 [Myxococcota bacterium]
MMLRSPLVLIFLAFGSLATLVVWSGCGGSDSSPCSSNEDCDDGEACFRSQCLPTCSEARDCAQGEGCQDGVCVPGGTGACRSAADCTNPTSPCESAEGATCAGGVCEYAPLVCDTPGAPRCEDGGSVLVVSSVPGTCNEQTGCEYEEQRIDVDPDSCEAIAAGDCDSVQCDDSVCLTNQRPTGEFCACEGGLNTPANVGCPGEAGLCSTDPRCDGEGNCVGTPVEDDLRCRDASGGEVVALDDDGEPRELADGEVAPAPFCLSGSCVECRVEAEAQDCDDGNPCTVDTCGDNGLCVNSAEPQDGAACELAEPGAIFGSTGFCRAGDCVQCDSTITDEAARDAACEVQGENGQLNQCAIGTCVEDVCDYDLDTPEGEGCNPLGGPGDNFCFQGNCVECFLNNQCPSDGNPCTNEFCDTDVSFTCDDPTIANDNQCTVGTRPASCFEGVCIDCSPGSPDYPDSVPDPQCNTVRAGFDSETQVACIVVARESIQGANCEDGNLCTLNDICTGGSFAGGSPAFCQPGAPRDCSTGPGTSTLCRGACNPSNGQCSQLSACNDGNSCTINDRCSGFACISDPKSCPGSGDCRQTCSSGVCSVPVGRSCGACGQGSCSSGGSCSGDLQCCSAKPCPDPDDFCNEFDRCQGGSPN